MQSLDILLVDDDSLVRAGIRQLIELLCMEAAVREASNGMEALKILSSQPIQLVITDITMPYMNGLELTRQIRDLYPEIMVMILSMHKGETYVRQALTAGAVGYLLKSASPQELRIAIHAVMSHQIYLSPVISRYAVNAYLNADDGDELSKLTRRQREILQLVAEGMSVKEIANTLVISPKTVETHRSHIMQRLKISDLPGLVRFAARHGLISLAE
jgi:two-component system response regulator NreC